MSTTQDIILQNIASGVVEVKEYEAVWLVNDVRDIIRVVNGVLNSPAKDLQQEIDNVKWRLSNLEQFLENICKDVK